MVLIWAFLLFLSTIAIFVSDPGIVITGETLALEIPLAWTLLPFDTLYFVATLIWFVLSRQDNIRNTQVYDSLKWPKWTSVNSIFLIIAVILVPLEYFFFNAGELHGTMDQVAVILTFVQYTFINLSLVPWRRKAAMQVSDSEVMEA